MVGHGVGFVGGLLHEQVVQPPVIAVGAVGAGVDYLDIFTSLKTERYDEGLLDTKGHTFMKPLNSVYNSISSHIERMKR